MDLRPGPVTHAQTIIEQFIRDRVESSGSHRVVLGLSGGLDSAVVLKLLSNVFPSDSIDAFFMPYGMISREDRAFASKAATSCGIEMKEMDITPVVDSVPIDTEGMVKGNLMARARMLFLYTWANAKDALVMGTSNKSELLMGYFTKYGDGAADLYPIGDLFKTQVRHLAVRTEVPGSIVQRPPSAGLVRGQTDESEMGVPYSILDQVLFGYLSSLDPVRIADEIDHTEATVDEMDRSGFQPPMNEAMVKMIINTVRSTRHKRNSLAIPKVQASTIGVDMRERW